MIKQVSNTTNADSIGLDVSLQQLAHLKPGDEVRVEVQRDGTIMISRGIITNDIQDVSELIESTMDAYAATMKRLA
jgi:antitoxin component of MazEF toxin-antitoxin module